MIDVKRINTYIQRQRDRERETKRERERERERESASESKSRLEGGREGGIERDHKPWADDGRQSHWKTLCDSISQSFWKQRIECTGLFNLRTT